MPENVAAAHHHGQLDAESHHALHAFGDAFHNLRVNAPRLVAVLKGFAAQFQQHALVLDRTGCGLVSHVVVLPF